MKIMVSRIIILIVGVHSNDASIKFKIENYYKEICITLAQESNRRFLFTSPSGIFNTFRGSNLLVLKRQVFNCSDNQIHQNY